MESKKLFVTFVVVLTIGMLVSLFLTYEHFSHSASEYCSFGENLDCGIVNKSPYANVDGIFYLMTIDWGWPIPLIDIAGIHVILDFLTSNAFLGFLTLLFILILLIEHREGKGFLWVKKQKTIKWIRGLLVFGVAYGFYLFLIQHFMLKTYCILCLTLDAVLVTSLILAWRLKE